MIWSAPAEQAATALWISSTCKGIAVSRFACHRTPKFMNYRRFGRTDWQVSEIGYGMWGMGGWSGSDDEDSMRALERSVALGCNFFDTAWAYGEGRSERLLGRLVQSNMGTKLYTATKIPPKNLAWPSRREFSLDDCYPADHIEKYVHSSLSNAGLESFDLVQFHTWEDKWLDDDRW